MLIDLPPTPAPRPLAPARDRILTTADELFSRDGIRAVGVDALIEQSKVTKATFYKHFRAKDRLVLDYLDDRHRREATVLADRLAPVTSPELALDEVRDWMIAQLGDRGQRGCAFLSAAIEFPDPGHPVRERVAVFRTWMREVLRSIATDLGHADSARIADDLLVARDGALLGGYAGDGELAEAALARAFDTARAPRVAAA